MIGAGEELWRQCVGSCAYSFLGNLAQGVDVLDVKWLNMIILQNKCAIGRLVAYGDRIFLLPLVNRRFH